MFHHISEGDPDRRRRRRPLNAVPAILLSSMLASGCFNGDSEARGVSDSEQEANNLINGSKTSLAVEGPEAPTDELARQLARADLLLDKVNRTYVTNAEAEETIEGLKGSDNSVDDHEAQTARSVAIDNLAINAALNGDDEDSPVSSMDEIKKLKLLPEEEAKVSDALRSNVVEEALEQIDWDNVEPEEFDFGDMNGTGVNAPDVVRKLAFDIDAAAAIEDIYDERSADEAAEDISPEASAEAHKLLTAARDYERADDAMSMYSIDWITPEEYEAVRGSITDADLQKLMADYQRAANVDDYEARRNLESKMWDVESELDEKIRRFEESVDERRKAVAVSPHDLFDQLVDSKAETFLSYDSTLTDKMIEANKGVVPTEFELPPPLEDPYEAIDLTGVTSDKIFRDDHVEYKEDTYERVDDYTEEYRQIAEVYVENGVMKLSFEASSNMGEGAKQQIEDIFKQLSPYLEAAFARGDALHTIRFLVDAEGTPSDFDFYPYYRRSTGEVEMVLPANASVSADMMRTTLAHELSHAIWDDIEYDDSMSESQVLDFNAACLSLNLQAREQLDRAMVEAGDKIQKVIDTMTSGSYARGVMMQLKKDFDNGTITDATVDETMATYSTTTRGGCWSPPLLSEFIRGSMDNFETLYGDGWSDDVTLDDAIDELKKNEHFLELVGVWTQAVNLSLYERFFDESNRVKSNSDVEWAMGHTGEHGDTSSELPASILGGIVADPETMALLYAGLSESDQAIVDEALSAVANTTAENYPTLESAIQNGVAIIRGEKP